MTDAVNVPREFLERLVAWINREVPVPTRNATRWAMDITDLLAAAPKAEPVEFGNGMLVVDTGRYGGKPAVFIAPAKIGGKVGESSEIEDHAKDALQDGETVWAFPTEEQARMVADALVNAQPEAPKVEQEPVANPLVFGLGALVVDHGKYGGEPAVFIAKAKAAGRVGELTGRDYFDRESLQPGELVLQFPTDTQAKSVADALVGIPAPASDELLEALKPFADAAVDLDDGETGHIWERPAAMSIDASDLRRASELYAKHKGPQ